VLSHILMNPVRSAATTGRGVAMTLSVVALLGGRCDFAAPAVRRDGRRGLGIAEGHRNSGAADGHPFGAMVTVRPGSGEPGSGRVSLVGAASGVGVIRQGAPITAGLLMGGAAAAAIASDLGARAIRDELDALRVMGIEPVRRLVVPRFLAMILIAPILCAIIIAAAVGASYILSVTVSGVSSGSFWMSFGSFAKMVDVWFTMGKAVLFAAMVAIISCLRGMEAKGGPRGVADAVNSSVVLNVVCIAIANLAVTQLQVMFFPMEIS